MSPEKQTSLIIMFFLLFLTTICIAKICFFSDHKPRTEMTEQEKQKERDTILLIGIVSSF